MVEEGKRGMRERIWGEAGKIKNILQGGMKTKHIRSFLK